MFGKRYYVMVDGKLLKGSYTFSSSTEKTYFREQLAKDHGVDKKKVKIMALA